MPKVLEKKKKPTRATPHCKCSFNYKKRTKNEKYCNNFFCSKLFFITYVYIHINNDAIKKKYIKQLQYCIKIRNNKVKQIQSSEKLA